MLVKRSLPFVSVVVPVRNDRRIRHCVDGLLAQSYPRERYEVIVVDNGSSDDTRATVAGEAVTLLVEDRVRSSYAARNLGIRHARGDVIAMIDADCRPSRQWIEEGVAALETGGADLVGGAIRFLYTPRPCGAEVYDALHNMQQARDVGTRRVAKTANLFVRARVVTAIGLFPEWQSGADVYWTRRATDAGLRLAFAAGAEVVHPTRRLGELLRKALRVGRGRYDRYAEESLDDPRRARTSPGYRWHDLKPPILPVLRGRLGEPTVPHLVARLPRVWSAGWLYRLTMVLGSVSRRIERLAPPPAALASEMPPAPPLADS